MEWKNGEGKGRNKNFWIFSENGLDFLVGDDYSSIRFIFINGKMEIRETLGRHDEKSFTETPVGGNSGPRFRGRQSFRDVF